MLVLLVAAIAVDIALLKLAVKVSIGLIKVLCCLIVIALFVGIILFI